MAVPPAIESAIKKIGGEVKSVAPVCEGSSHFIVLFAANPGLRVSDLPGAASLAATAEGYRAHFIRKEES